MGSLIGGGGGKVKIGFRYYMSLLMGLCVGPVDEIVQINVGDVCVWPLPDGKGKGANRFATTIAKGPGGIGVRQFKSGNSENIAGSNVNTVSGPGNETRSINAGEVFGGDKKEGGIDGELNFMFGAPTQSVTARIKNLIGGRVSNFRGVVTLFYDGLITSMNPYPKAWSVRVRRVLEGWDGDVWQPALAVIWMQNNRVKAMNPTHIIYECITNRAWGRGWPRTVINDAVWTATAEKLRDETFGLCLKWNSQTELDEFIQEVIDLIGGTLYTDLATGLINLELLRDDYIVETLPRFTYTSGLLSIENGETVAQDDLVNEVIVNWHNPVLNEDRQVRSQNLALRQSLGAIKSTTATYDGIPSASLATRIADRDKRTVSTPLKRFVVTLDRRGSSITPGKVFRVSAPDKGIQDIILRAGTRKTGEITDGAIKIDAIIDVFGLSAAVFSDDDDGGFIPPDNTPVSPERILLRESTYADMIVSYSRADRNEIPNDVGFISILAGKPTSESQDYRIASRAGGEDFRIRGAGSFAPSALLANSVAPNEMVFDIEEGIDLEDVTVGMAVEIGPEICRLDAITLNEDMVSGTITVGRGCTDTIPTALTAGMPLFFATGYIGHDYREYAEGEDVDVMALTSTSSQDLAIEDGEIWSIEDLSNRRKLPWICANVQVGGVPYADLVDPISGNIVITWVHRNRFLIQDILIAHNESGTTREDDQTYNLNVYDGASAVDPVRSVTGIIGTSFTYTTAMMATDAVGTELVFRIRSERDGNYSFARHIFTVNRV